MDVNATISSAAGLLGSITLTGVFNAILSLVVCLLLKKVVLKLVTKALNRTKLDSSLTKITLKVLSTVLWVVIILVLCEALGIKVTSLLALFSVVGLAFSLALQDSLSNLASGIMLLAGHPFKIGDYVEAGGQEGTVRNIGIIHTLLATPDNKLIYVPNSAISSSKIVNYSTEPNRRLDIAISASYDAPTAKVREALLDAANSHELVLRDPAPVVLLTEYGESAIRYTLRLWTRNSDYWTVNGQVREDIRESFAKHGVAMTYNHVNVHMMKD